MTSVYHEQPRRTLQTSTSDGGSVHTYSQEEKRGIVEHINSILKNDPHLEGKIPIDPSSDAIFEAVKDGVLIWYVIFIIIYLLIGNTVS
jgi:hypothetical protein